MTFVNDVRVRDGRPTNLISSPNSTQEKKEEIP